MGSHLAMRKDFASTLFPVMASTAAKKLLSCWATEANARRSLSGTTMASKEVELTEDNRKLAEGILAGSHSSLSRGITLCESTRSDHRGQASALLQYLQMARLLHAESQAPMFRVALTGPPGAGKSTLIEVLGSLATRAGEKVAVLAIDPSSDCSGGSILGDKTRMDMLSIDPSAFVRPTPARGHLGGIARNTADAALLCEAGGSSVLMIETVGGGQSDTAVVEVVDMVVLILPPAGGDELQGMKRGVVEIADLLVVNKADGELQKAAARTVADYRNALHMMSPRSKTWNPRVVSCSGRTRAGILELWELMCEFKQLLATSGELQARRKRQNKQLLWSNLKTEVLERLRTNAVVQERLRNLEQQVVAGKLASRAAAYQMATHLFAHGAMSYDGSVCSDTAPS